MIKLAINGFGRIGRIFFRQAFGHKDFEIAAVNDLSDRANLEYLLRYDTVYGKYEKGIGDVQFLQEKDPAKLPWKDLGIDVVVESTGVFESFEKSQPHLDAGAKHVVITAPAKDDLTPTVTPNVGMERLRDWKITSNASCTTNAVSPIMAIMSLDPGVKKAALNTVHGYTATQGIVDGPAKKDFRRGRAAAQNIVPSSTGAASATTKALPYLLNKFDGIAIRVPVVTGSLIDVTFIAERQTTAEEINEILKEHAAKDEWKDIIEVTNDPIVSSDIIGNPHGTIVDLAMTRVIDGDLVKILSWYDNEWGYCAMLMKHIQEVAKLIEN